MSAPPVLEKVYREHIEHFGEPNDSIIFDDKVETEEFPKRVDVLVWEADEDCDITTFATIGMATLPMPKTSHRAELHFSIRRSLTQEEKHDVARFLANLAMYPFQVSEPVDWWHTLSNPGKIPLFKLAECVLLHPRFVTDGWDSIVTEAGEVHILNVIPITREEKDLRNVSSILERLVAVDMFALR